MNKFQFEFLSFYKKNYIKINLSSTFLARSICKGCGELPDTYYWINQPSLWINPGSSHAVFSWYKKFSKKINGFWYKEHEPRYFYSIKDFSFNWIEKGYKPSLHQHVGISQENNIIEYLTCPCGSTVWAFSQKSVENRMEIKNRKARYKYPKRFESY